MASSSTVSRSAGVLEVTASGFFIIENIKIAEMQHITMRMPHKVATEILLQSIIDIMLSYISIVNITD